MKCPYVLDQKVKSTSEEVKNYSGAQIKNRTDIISTTHTRCIKESCAAWQGGKCNYKG